MESKNVNLELGDIIKLYAPTNEELNNKVFIISYIDNSIIDLKSSELNISLNLADNKLTEESITKISIVYKPELKGFVKQSNLNIENWIDIHFDTDIPTIITGKITNIDEDMIEINIYPSNEIIYIDFEYHGIPKNLNIEKIVIREEPSIKTKVTEEEEEEDHSLEDISEEMFEDDLSEISKKTDSVKLQEDIIKGSQIIFGELLGELVQEVEVDEKLKRYDLESQTNDLLDELLSKIPKQNRTYSVIKSIHTYIERYKQLRTQFSTFDTFGNLTDKILKGTNHKPLKENLEKLNRNIHWIMPVVVNKKKIYPYEDCCDEDTLEEPFIMSTDLGPDIEEMNQIKGNQIPIDETTTILNNILNKLEKYFIPFSQHLTDLSLVNIDSNTNLEALVNNIEDFKTYSIKYNNLDTNKHELVKYTNNNTLNIIGFLLFPKLIIDNSKKYLPEVSIYDKSILNSHDIYKSRFLKKNIIENIEILDIETEYNYKDFYKNIKYITQDNSIDKNYSNLLDSMIPKIKTLIKIINEENIKENKLIVSFDKFVSMLEPFNIYYSDLTFGHYKEINYIINDNILKYKQQFSKTQIAFDKYKNIRNSEYKKYKLYYSKITNLLENYKIYNKNISTEEFIRL